MTLEQLAKIKHQVDGKRPRPRVYAMLNDGSRRRVLSMGSDWVRIYVRNEKTRIGASRIVSIHGLPMSEVN